MGKKRFYDAVRDLIRDVHDTCEQPSRTRRRLSVESLLAAPQACAACWDQVPSQGRLFSCHNCLGAFCPSCLTQYARSAIKDRSLLPLRCAAQDCRAPIPLSALQGLLSVDEVTRLSRFQYEMMRQPDEQSEHSLEAATPPTDDPGNEAALNSLMGDMGWRRCPDCGTGIERTHGCPHMVCVCGGEFCYSCGERWGAEGAGCPRRCGLPNGYLLGFLPDQFEQLRDEVRTRITAVLESLREHLERDTANRRLTREASELDLPRVSGLRAAAVGPGRPLTRSLSRSRSSTAVSQEGRPAKMVLRSLVHPTSDNRL